MWFELLPAPDSPDMDDQYQRRTRAMADALGLSARPGWLDWWRHDDGCRLVASGPRRWLEVSDRYGRRAAQLFARAANATLQECDEPTQVLEEPQAWAHAFVPISASLARTPRDDAPDREEARLEPSQGTVVVITVRRMGWVESNRNSNWIADELNRQADGSKLRGAGVGVARIMAGAPSKREALDQARESANALGLGLVPGLSSHLSRPGLGLLLASLPMAMSGLLLAILAHPLCGLLALPLPFMAWRWWRRRDPINDVDQRPRHRWWWARTRFAHSSDHKTMMAGDDQNTDSKRRVYAYAFQRSSFPLPSGALAAIAAPPADRTATVSALTVRPDQLAQADGPLVGVDAQGEPIRMWQAALYGGIALFGEPGGGKSNMMHGVTAWLARHHRTGDVLVDFESKGVDSVPTLTRIAGRLPLVDVCDPATPMIDVLGAGDAHDKAERFSALMRAALGEQQIGPQSRIQLRDSVEAALLALDAPGFPDQCRAQGAPLPRTWVECAARLLGREGVSDARALGRACSRATHADALLERLHGGVTPETGRPRIRDGELAQLLRAPMNKMDILAGSHVFTPGRRSINWNTLIARSRTHGDARILVNLGAAVHPDPSGRHADLTDDQRRLIGALLFRGLKDEVEASCGGWQAEGRHMRIIVDELTDVLGGDGRSDGGNADILAWLREKGRAYGVELMVGTQNTTQLADALLASVASLMTVGSFVLRSDVTAGPAAAALGVDASLVRGLPRHTCAIRTVGGPPDMASLPVMVARIPHFDAGEHVDA